MLLRQKPSNPQLYYICNETKSQELQQNNFHPMYLYEHEFYFKLTDKLKEYLKGGDISG
ncbi:MAG: hypothetical protein PHN69_06110 [Candidatus Pacebacteria bacterium]|nr:hypothetical protein [Candidatus Paceibacterota bacterium]